MLTTFKVVLMVIAALTAVGTIGQAEVNKQSNTAAVCVASVGALCVTFLWV